MGVGKSALVNGLIGDKVAPEGDTAESVTDAVYEYKKTINDVDVIIFDTPGFSDPKPGRDHETLREICQKTDGTVDLLLICLKMTDRLEQTHVLIIEALKLVFKTDDVWKSSLLVLTFANEVRLPRRRQICATPQPEDKTEQQLLNDHFEQKLSDFKTVLLKYFKGHIPPKILEEIPVVPAGFEDTNLPGYDDWLSTFWVQVFTRTSNSAKIALLRITEHRFIENPSRETMPPHLQPINMTVATGAIVGAALGRVVGMIKAPFSFQPKEIEKIRRECENKGASLGARFVLCFYNLKSPLRDWVVEQIPIEHFLPP